jgi:dTDP-4-amino-4,6-dideoxygalactose transaminase
MKVKVSQLAVFGGVSLFTEPKSTSSLAQPDFENFLTYSREFFDRRYYTNNGFLVRQLEARLAKFHSADFCITFCSGFWGLVLAMTALSLKGKSEVIMPSLTYRRMADIAAWARLTPRFCEVDPNTLALNHHTIRDCITSDTALILAVHPIVNCLGAGDIQALGKEYGIPVLFDSVESMYESTSLGKVGGFGDAECFSMHASKLLNGFEGGYITTNDKALATKLSLLRSYGFEGQDNCVITNGLNAKLNEVHAAMALANLDEMESVVARNKERYERYDVGLAFIDGLRLVEFDADFKSSYKNILIEISSNWPVTRDQTVSILNSENVLSRAYYNPPLHKRDMAYPSCVSELPVTEALAGNFILLPCGEFVTCADIDQIISLLRFISVNGGEINKRLFALGDN